jgi:tetratricopeptide (TPR) repeat protein
MRLAPIVGLLLLMGPSTGSAQDIPRDDSDLLARAQFAIDSGALETAASLLERALDRDPFNKSVRLGLVDLLMRLGRGEDAEKQAEILRKQSRNDAQVAYVSAAVAFHRLDFEASERHASEAVRLGGGSVEAYRLRAFARFMLEDYTGYVDDLKAIVERDPKNADAFYHLGRFYYENQDFSEGLAALERSALLDPSHFRALYFLGWCQQAQGDIAEAKESYRASIEAIQALRVSYGWPFTDLGDLLITEGDYGDGLGWLYQAVRNDPDLPYSRYKYASGLMKEAPTAEVEEQLLKAVQLDPGYTEAYYLLGRYFQAVGEMEKSREAFARFQQLRQNPEASPQGVKRGR